ncbi:MAG: HD domain-containing protein [Lachnospiraceae bacterium]|nr:HD domain-containing protein [Lachnospiraceae bacterium]
MKYIQELRDGDRMSDVYLIKHKQAAVTKNGKPYENVILQDKTGTIDAKIWEPNSAGIGDFDVLDYVEIVGEVSSYNGQLQVSIKRARLCHEGEYNPANYLPMSSKNIDEMYNALLGLINSVQNKYLKYVLEDLFVKDEKFIKEFKYSSAAKAVHHGFVGGLLEHTLSVTQLCDFFSKQYPKLNRDLLITAAICHDIGKTKELSAFPKNDYTDEGQFIGHIVIGVEMVDKIIDNIPDFPPFLAAELRHCILSHHGELEFGSPKKPAIMEAVALNFADNTDAKMETFTELLNSTTETGWLGFNRLLDSNLIRTREE